MVPERGKVTGEVGTTKLMALDYYTKKYRTTLEEWRKFVQGDMNVDKSVVSGEVLESWIRCKDLGIDPLKQSDNKVLAGQELQALLESNTELIDVSRPFMKNLFRFLKGSGFLVTLCNSDGYLLEIIGDHDDLDLIRKSKGVVGALWDEKSSGNSATGTVIELKKPVQIYGSQHYLRMYHGETGSGAPIFGPEGQFIGGISLAGRYYRANPHTLGMAVAAANAIENELKIRKAFKKYQVAYSYQRTVMSSILEALMAVDMGGYITLINDNARKIFSFENGSGEGRHIRELIGHDNHQFYTLIDNHEAVTDVEVRIFTRNMGSDYTLTCNPILSPEGEAIGKIIVLNEIRRAKSMVTKMMGVKAKFRFDDICGRNSRFLMTIDQARTVSQSNSNVLLLGKSGTGKDLFAQAIHNASARKNGPYLAINCGAIPRDLITSELFGHEEGAFTGAKRGGNQGKFELADGGTIFLDEIAEMPLELQTALLRVIEDKSVMRIGGTRIRPVDVRIIAATNKDLKEEVRKGNFREDLYFRANVFAIEMVPLRDRPDDIPLLVDCFIKRYEIVMKKKIDRIDNRVWEIFMNYHWPGNVRELQNVIERMMNFVQDHELNAGLIPAEIVQSPNPFERFADLEPPEERERKMIMKMIRMKFNKNQIAEQMNISRATLYRKMNKFKLS
ncbi:MAG: sigma-54-dependent Fis family transcriptional regulator [Syntrophales bacterium]|nr:sigma-54-dependent Fis family transcriptional regulator [Syntrophales bacterium]